MSSSFRLYKRRQEVICGLFQVPRKAIIFVLMANAIRITRLFRSGIQTASKYVPGLNRKSRTFLKMTQNLLKIGTINFLLVCTNLGTPIPSKCSILLGIKTVSGLTVEYCFLKTIIAPKSSTMVSEATPYRRVLTVLVTNTVSR